METLSPEAGRQRGMDQKGAHDVIRCANHPLSLAVLRRGIRTRHAHLNTSREKERTGGGVVELTPVVTLDGLNGEAELSGHPGKKVEEGGKGLRLGAQRKSPRVMRKIINHHQIVFITRNAGYRRRPQVTMNKIKSMCRMRRRRKKKSNMTTKLARMTKVLSRSPSTRNISITTKPSQNIAAGVTKPEVPGGGRRCRGKSSRRRGSRRLSSGSRKAKGVKGPRTVTSEERTPGSRILHSKTR